MLHLIYLLRCRILQQHSTLCFDGERSCATYPCHVRYGLSREQGIGFLAVFSYYSCIVWYNMYTGRLRTCNVFADVARCKLRDVDTHICPKRTTHHNNSREDLSRGDFGLLSIIISLRIWIFFALLVKDTPVSIKSQSSILSAVTT